MCSNGLFETSQRFAVICQSWVWFLYLTRLLFSCHLKVASGKVGRKIQVCHQIRSTLLKVANSAFPRLQLWQIAVPKLSQGWVTEGFLFPSVRINYSLLQIKSFSLLGIRPSLSCDLDVTRVSDERATIGWAQHLARFPRKSHFSESIFSSGCWT